MREIQAPQYAARGDLFLAGGITGTHDWQQSALHLLADLPGVVYNPRRSSSFEDNQAEEQVEWEYRALRASSAIMFWFPPETLCPITLFELGVWSNQREVPIYVGTDPVYARRFDVMKQLSLSKPEIVVHDNLAGVVADYAASLAI